MQHSAHRTVRPWSWAFFSWTVLLTLVAGSTDRTQLLWGLDTTPDVALRKSLEHMSSGDFQSAAKAIDGAAANALTAQISDWLSEYEAKQKERKKLDRADLEKYIGYAKARIERKEYSRALGWALAALDCADDRDAFLDSDWVVQLSKDALSAANELRHEALTTDYSTKTDPKVTVIEATDPIGQRHETMALVETLQAIPDEQPNGEHRGETKDNEVDKDNDNDEDEPEDKLEDSASLTWTKAWRIYARLSTLFDREPRYRKLAREAVNHIRLDSMFRDDSHWEERIEKVRWRDAEKALEFIGLYYVEPADFKKITEHGLEQIYLLSQSTTAQAELEGLANEEDRRDFQARVQRRLQQVRATPTLDRADCVRHFRRVIKRINKETVRIPENLLVSELMRGALEPLDDFTNIIWPSATREFDKHTKGKYIGVGIRIVKNNKYEIEVVSPMDNAPAYRAGIQAGDIITKVFTDGKTTELKGMSINKVVDTIMGKEGTELTLSIRRGDLDIDFDLTRRTVKIVSVKGLRRNENDEEKWEHWLDRDLGIGYIQVTGFQGNTVEDVHNTLSELLADGLKGLVLDLRGNPGGLLDSAWHMSSLFLKRGDDVVSTKGRIRSEDQTFQAESNGPFSDLALTVLVDDRSASASEIVSGAIRDNQRGTVIGERTFGKFSVQNLVQLSRNGAKLKITTARYYLPNGESLHREPGASSWGVEPDIPIRLVRKEKNKLWTMRREADLLGPAKADNKKDDEKKDDDDKADSATDKADDDKQDPAVAEVKPKGDELPPLKQPDENLRPKEDPQLDTALLVTRAQVLAERTPKLATAERNETKKAVRP